MGNQYYHRFFKKIKIARLNKRNNWKYIHYFDLMSVWSLLLLVHNSSKKEPIMDLSILLQKMIINVQNDRTNKEPIFKWFFTGMVESMLLYYSRALSMEEWV
jgi:hypothetical protein